MIKNAIVLMFDTLQFNYLGCYGNDWIKTPNMDRLAREGVLFENSYTEGVPTIPCRRAMHTGRYTLPYAGWTPMTAEDTSIADLCWGRPIDTALIFDCPMYRLPKFGYTRGFDKVWFTHGHEGDADYYAKDPIFHLNMEDYFDEKTSAAYLERHNPAVANATFGEMKKYLAQRQFGGEKEENRYVAKTIDKAIEYLEQVDRQKQFYLWIDSFDPHEPWDPPSVWDPEKKCMYDPDYEGKDEFLPFPDVVEGLYTEPQLHHIRMLYAEMVTLCDKYLGKLLDALKRMGFEENTLFMMVSDHGQPLGNGEHGHGLLRKMRPWPYEELVHTPLLLRAPGIKAGQRIKGFVQSCDVAPTVCDWLGIGVHPDMQGHSLLKLASGEVEKVRDFAIAGYYSFSWAIYTEEYSYIHWVKNAESTGDMIKNFYNTDTDSSHLEATGATGFGDDFVGDDVPAHNDDVQAQYKKEATIDGKDQWTCTPASSSEVPEKDELYDRINDPFQLNNIIDKEPEIARKLYDQLREYITELQVL